MRVHILLILIRILLVRIIIMVMVMVMVIKNLINLIMLITRIAGDVAV